jgi:hypothetical protein
MVPMKTSDVATYFGSEYKTAQALGIHQANITRWEKKVPEIWARRLHDMTGGKLHFDINDYPVHKRVRGK